MAVSRQSISLPRQNCQRIAVFKGEFVRYLPS
jgi:hypothetical protein